jgi:class 3 adenylate cyclase
MRADLPAGTVTFVFTDVEGSTRLLDELGADAYAEALAEHRRVVREALASAGGAEVVDIRAGHLGAGLALSAEALAYFHEAGDPDGVMLGLGNISTGLLRGGLVESAAVLDAASSRMATELGVGATAIDQALSGESSERYRADLPPTVRELAAARGSAMTADEAVAFALEACRNSSEQASGDQ